MNGLLKLLLTGPNQALLCLSQLQQKHVLILMLLFCWKLPNSFSGPSDKMQHLTWSRLPSIHPPPHPPPLPLWPGSRPHPGLVRIPFALAAPRMSSFLWYLLLYLFSPFNLLLLLISYFSLDVPPHPLPLLGPSLPSPSDGCSPHQHVSLVTFLIWPYFTFTFSLLTSLQDGNHLSVGIFSIHAFPMSWPEQTESILGKWRNK